MNSMGQLSLQDTEGQIPPKYAGYKDVFLKDKASNLPKHGAHNLAIKL